MKSRNWMAGGFIRRVAVAAVIGGILSCSHASRAAGTMGTPITIVALGESLGLEVVAEGVETEGQRAFLAHQGCHAYQGYLFSPPLPIADFDAFVVLRQPPAP